MNIPIPALRGLGGGGGSRAALVACSVVIGALASTALAQPAEETPFAEKAAAEPFQKDVTSMNASFGGTMNAGNTQATSVSAGSTFGLVRGRHGLSLSMDFAYGRARVTDPVTRISRTADTVRNMRARGRYDLFLTPLDALFLAGQYRWDPFAGLDARNEGLIGYKRYLYKEDKHLLWGELGYDLTYDNYDPDPLPDPTTPGRFLPGHEYVHAARLFFGYDNQLNDAVQLLTGVEGLLDVKEPKDFRFNWDLAIRSSIVSRLQLELKFSLQFDNVPVPGKKSLDAQTRANLIYTLI
jgi:putative salt-induced outer membrane protein YdiY